jgi:hypothetical protein
MPIIIMGSLGDFNCCITSNLEHSPVIWMHLRLHLYFSYVSLTRHLSLVWSTAKIWTPTVSHSWVHCLLGNTVCKFTIKAWPGYKSVVTEYKFINCLSLFAYSQTKYYIPAIHSPSENVHEMSETAWCIMFVPCSCVIGVCSEVQSIDIVANAWTYDDHTIKKSNGNMMKNQLLELHKCVVWILTNTHHSNGSKLYVWNYLINFHIFTIIYQ